MDVEQRFAAIVAKSLDIDPAEVQPSSTLDDDLGAESLDLVEITMESESQFNIWIPEESILDTAEKIFGPGVLHQDGVLTETGKKLLQERLPPEEAAAVASEEVRLADVQGYFMKVRTWIRMIQDLIDHTPTSCVDCGSKDLEWKPGFRLRCKNCDTELQIRSGQELNHAWVQEYYETVYLPTAKETQEANAD